MTKRPQLLVTVLLGLGIAACGYKAPPLPQTTPRSTGVVANLWLDLPCKTHSTP